MVGTDRELNIKFVVDSDGAVKAVKDLDGSLEKVESSGDKAAKGLTNTQKAALAGAAAIAAASAAFLALGKVASAALERAANIEGVVGAFQQFEAQGKLAAGSIEGLQDATKGLVSDFDLMQQANQAVLLGVADGSGKFQDMAAAAVKLGEATGRTATEALSDLVTGIGRASPLILDNLGITVSAAEAQELYAEQLGKTADQLTESEKKEAFRAAALIKIKEATSQLNEVEITAAKGKQQLNVQTQNLIDKFSIAFSRNTELGGAFSDLAKQMENVPVEKLAGYFGELITVIAQLAARALPALTQKIEEFRIGLSVISFWLDNAADGHYSWADAVKSAEISLRTQARQLDINRLQQEKLNAELETNIKKTDDAVVATNEQAGALENVAIAAEKVIKQTEKLNSLPVPQIVGANRLPASGAQGASGLQAQAGSLLEGAGLAPAGGGAAIAYQVAQEFSNAIGPLIGEAFNDGIESEEFKDAISGVVGSASGPFAPITTALSDALFDGIKGVFDSTDAQTAARESVDGFLQEVFGAANFQAVVGGELKDLTNLIFNDSGFASGESFEAFNQLEDSARRSFEGVGQALTSLLGISEDIGSQIGAVFVNNLGNDLFNLKLAVEQTGFSIDQMGDALVQSALKGELSFLEVQSALIGLGQIAEDGVPGQIGAIDVAFEKMKASGVLGGKATTEALKAIAAEALELGITTVPGLQQALLDAGATEADVRQIAEAMNEAEVSVEQLASATDTKLIQVLADLESQGFAFADKASDQVDNLIRKMDSLPNIEREIKLKVRTEASDSVAQSYINGEGL